jgi:hypothetical protein
MSKPKVKWHDTKKGEGRELPIGFTRLEACCDCGLVHKHTYAVEPIIRKNGKPYSNRGRVVEYVERDNRATAALRRKMVKDRDMVRLDESNAYIIIRRIDQHKARKAIKMDIEPCK